MSILLKNRGQGMKIERYLTICVILLLTISSLTVLVQPVESESNTEEGSLAPHKEMTEPDDISDPREITEDLTVYEFTYRYDMNYDIPPENVVLNIEGKMEKVDYEPEYMISITRPDGVKFDRIIDDEITESQTAFEINLSFMQNKDVRERIFEWGQKSGNQDDIRPFQIDPIELIFSKENEDILTDPEMLKGEYKFKITMMGKGIDFQHGRKKTCLFIMSEEPSEARNLQGKYENGEVALDWDKPEDIGGSEIIQYNIYRATTMYDYVCIDTVSPNQTDYVDDFEGETILPQYKTGFDGDVLFYRVAAVNKDNKYYMQHINSDWSLSKIPAREFWRPLSTQEVIHVPLQYEGKKSDKSYKWVMDYSKFSEEDFEKKLDRKNIMDITGIKINELTGGDVFFYKVNYIGEEYGERKYEYQGGFYSKGKADMEIRSPDSPSRFNINIPKSWIKFSGNIWAKEISADGYEGLSITKQTIKSEGRIKSYVNGTYDFEFSNENMHWETSKNTDIKWDLALTLDYEGNNSWAVKRKKNTPVPPASYEFNYSGSLNAQVNINKDDNHDYSDKKIDKSIDKQFSESKQSKVLGVGHLYSEFTFRKFTPIIGASRVGYCLAFSQALDTFSHDEFTSEWSHFSPIRHPFSSNCQAYDFSKDKLYRHQCLDPMVIPGLGSLIGTELKRIEGIFHKNIVESLVKERIREEIKGNPALDELNSSELEEWREKREKELKVDVWGAMFTGNTYILDQQKGPLGNEYVERSISWIEPLGYFGSKPSDEGDMKSFEDDRKKFFENQIHGKDEGNGGLPGFEIGILMIGVFFVIIYRFKERKQ